MLSPGRSSTDAGFFTSISVYRVSCVAWSLTNLKRSKLQVPNSRWMLSIWAACSWSTCSPINFFALLRSSKYLAGIGKIASTKKTNGFPKCLILQIFDSKHHGSLGRLFWVPHTHLPRVGSPSKWIRLSPHLGWAKPRDMFPIDVAKVGHHCSLCHILSQSVI